MTTPEWTQTRPLTLERGEVGRDIVLFLSPRVLTLNFFFPFSGTFFFVFFRFKLKGEKKRLKDWRVSKISGWSFHIFTWFFLELQFPLQFLLIAPMRVRISAGAAILSCSTLCRRPKPKPRVTSDSFWKRPSTPVFFFYCTSRQQRCGCGPLGQGQDPSGSLKLTGCRQPARNERQREVCQRALAAPPPPSDGGWVCDTSPSIAFLSLDSLLLNSHQGYGYRHPHPHHISQYIYFFNCIQIN